MIFIMKEIYKYITNLISYYIFLFLTEILFISDLLKFFFQNIHPHILSNIKPHIVFVSWSDPHIQWRNDNFPWHGNL